ncbi:conserved hypothetical protein [uncultured Sporomusa sp.]|uniref:Uncharacterized protein n=1 Tax=uncultured Sporomusa sp. TaxID=307249 RepID=A0A212LZ94_9FIRM|nr:SIR2 family protein [uncultured Sporomusa sp.]SCM82924.1 conserved hypothetical protein [uncultured Sporomusa sp.]
MDINSAINYALEGDALLFAGSGFSYGAKNLNNTNFNVGDKLRDIIAEACGIPSTRSLSIVSEVYISEKSEDDLIALLKKEFSLSSVASWHNDIMSVQWKRVYTTNYDSVIETAAANNSRKLIPIVLSRDIAKEDINNVCVHLNGHIDSLDRNTLNNEFKLIDRSYECETLEDKEWFRLFKGDLQTAKAIIIIGYSMQYDIDIKRLLGAPAIRKKVLFIDSPYPDPTDKKILEKHGACEFIGVQAFAEKIKKIQTTFVPSLIEKEFYSFLHEYRKTLTPYSVSFNELTNFYHNGEYIDALSQKNHGDYQYLILRTAADIFIRSYRDQKVFLATSDLGNGKTVFCQLVRNELRNDNVDVFFFTHEYNDCDSEIQRICSKSGRSVVIIDDYKNKLNILQRFKYYGINRLTFVLTARKAVNPSYRVLIDRLGVTEADIRPLHLDTFDIRETKALSNIILDNKLYNKNMTDTTLLGIENYIQNKCHSRFADILLAFYHSSHIKDRISQTWENNSNEPLPVKRLAILSLMKSVMGIDFNFTEMLNLLKINYASLMAKESEFINEFFNISDDDVIIKSSIIARELLSSVIGLMPLIDTMKEVIVEADKEHHVSGAHYELLKNLVSHSHFRLFRDDPKSKIVVLSFYNSIRNLSFCKDNTFFWEQFASACIEAKEFVTANQCIETAFAIAKGNPRFVPYHIETIKAKCILEKMFFDINSGKRPSSEEAINSLIECHDRLIKYFDHPDNNVGYVFKTGSRYAEVFEIYKHEFDNRQKSIFAEKRVKMLKLMKEQQSSSEIINAPLNRWIQDLEKCT